MNPLPAPVPASARIEQTDLDRIARLEELVADLLDRDSAREAENIVLRVRIGMLESKQPAPRFEVPENWITVEQAASRCGAGKSTVARWCATGKIISASHGGRTYIDPESLYGREKLRT
jgi:Helix-turn-helix domain